jgi:hypothetical protein
MKNFKTRVIEVIEDIGERVRIVPVNRGGYKRNFNLYGKYKKVKYYHEYVKVILEPVDDFYFQDKYIQKLRLKKPYPGHCVGEIIQVSMNATRTFKGYWWVKYA